MIFNNTLNTGNVFSFSGSGDSMSMGTEIIIDNPVEGETRIHTSCSVEIETGSVFDSYTVVSGSSVKGGMFCDGTEECKPPGNAYGTQ